MESHPEFAKKRSEFQRHSVKANILNFGTLGRTLKELGLIRAEFAESNLNLSRQEEQYIATNIFQKKLHPSLLEYTVQRNSTLLYPSKAALHSKMPSAGYPILSIFFDNKSKPGNENPLRNGFYRKKSRQIERLAYVSFYDQYRRMVVSTAAGVRISGNTNKAIEIKDIFSKGKGFSIFFRKAYGLNQISGKALFQKENVKIEKLIVHEKNNRSDLKNSLEGHENRSSISNAETKTRILLYLNGFEAGIRTINPFFSEKNPTIQDKVLTGPVIISEAMFSNNTTLTDEEGDFSDWIELYNISQSEIDLEGWFLTDDMEIPTRWRFPNVSLKPKGYLLIFLSGKNKKYEGKEIHTNFKMKKSGEFLGLFLPDGKTVVNRIDASIQHTTDVSYGYVMHEETINLLGLKNEGKKGYLQSPTPGAFNADEFKWISPIITQHNFRPKFPRSRAAIIVETKVKSKIAPNSSVIMYYKRMFDHETAVSMTDDGRFPDAVANDGVFSAVIPTDEAIPGDMIRWYVIASDIAGNTVRTPGAHDRTGDRQDPRFYGTMISDLNLKSRLPILYWFAEDPEKGHTREGTRGCIYYNGTFYDNIYVCQRGRSTNKRHSQKFVFNKGYAFYVNENLGSVSEFNLNGPGLDASFLRQPIGFENYRRNGVPASECFLMRVQTNGQFDRVGIFIEQVDEKFLQRNGYHENGVLYKFVQRDQKPVFKDLNGVKKKSQRWEDASDMQAVIDNLDREDKNKRCKFLMDHFDIPQLVNRLAVMVMHREVDSIRKNFYFYHDMMDSGRWSMFPWDLDLLFGNTNPGKYAGHPLLGDRSHPLHPQKQWSVLLDVFYNLPDFRTMFLRRLRTLMDDYLQTPETPENKCILENRIDSFFEEAKTELRLKHSRIDESIRQLKQSIQDRRFELFVKYRDLIPEKQPETVSIQFSEISYPAPNDSKEEEYISIFNPNDIAVDMSLWQLSGAVDFTFKPGTVLNAKSYLFMSPDIKVFQKNHISSSEDGLFVQGPYLGYIKNADEALVLKDVKGRFVTKSTFLMPSE